MIKKVLKWIGIILGGLVGLLVVAFVVLYFVGSAKANQTYELPVESISIPSDAASIERGKHMAMVILCTRCHTENLGGEVYFTIPGMLTIPTPNLTSGAGGVASSYTDEDWVCAIRHGVGKDGRALFLMSPANQYLSAEDLGAIIAYMKSLPPVDNQLPERRIEVIGRIMMAIGMMPPVAVEVIDHTAPVPEGVEPGVSAAYGEYLTHTCKECHGAELNGAPFGPPGQEVPTPNLTPGGELSAGRRGFHCHPARA
jgi:cytochrome c553